MGVVGVERPLLELEITHATTRVAAAFGRWLGLTVSDLQESTVPSSGRDCLPARYIEGSLTDILAVAHPGSILQATLRERENEPLIGQCG